MKRTEVLIVINDLLRGGAQRIVADIVHRADREKFSFSVLYFNAADTSDSLAEELQASGASLVLIHEGTLVKNFIKLWAHIRNTRPDIITAFLPYANILARVAGFSLRVPVISVQCNLPFTYPWGVRIADAVTLPLSRAWLGATSGIEAAHAADAAFFSEDLWARGRRHFTVYGGVDVRRISDAMRTADVAQIRKDCDIPDSVPVIMSVARLVSWKGHEGLIDALVDIPDAHLLIIGWGPLETSLKQRAETQGVLSRVHFLGRRTDVYTLFAIADCYVQAHQHSGKHSWEGPNLSQIEACAAGIPSVSTAVPRIEELIEEGITGHLAAMGDSRALAQAIQKTLRDTENAKRMADVAKERALKQYAVDDMVHIYEYLYEHLT